MAIRRAWGLALFFVAGCGGTEVPTPVTFSYIHPAIIQPSCATSGCHSDWSRTAGLSLERRDKAYEFFLKEYVEPGDAEDSDLMEVLTGEEGFRMPLDAPLPRGDIELIRRWINEGARL
jgi:hypothetical protein